MQLNIGLRCKSIHVVFLKVHPTPNSFFKCKSDYMVNGYKNEVKVTYFVTEYVAFTLLL